MKWRIGRKSGNVEDRRSAGIPGGAVGGIGGLILLLILIVSVFMGIDPSQILQGGPSTGPIGQPSQLSEEQQNKSIGFVSLVLGDTETTWSEIFKDQLGSTYIDPKLVLIHRSCAVSLWPG
jgi:uncharacterized protein